MFLIIEDNEDLNELTGRLPHRHNPLDRNCTALPIQLQTIFLKSLLISSQFHRYVHSFSILAGSTKSSLLRQLRFLIQTGIAARPADKRYTLGDTVPDQSSFRIQPIGHKWKALFHHGFHLCHHLHCYLNTTPMDFPLSQRLSAE